ncbi:protein of unknown function [Streptomyces murinus]
MTLGVRGQRLADFLEEGSIPKPIDQPAPDHGDPLPVPSTTNQLCKLTPREPTDDVSQEDGLLLLTQLQGLQHGHELLA